MPEVIWLSGGIVVPTGVVGTGEAEPVDVEEVAEAEEEGEEEEEETDEVGDEEDADVDAATDCLFARRTWRSLVASTAVRRAKRATRAWRCMTGQEKKEEKERLRETVGRESTGGDNPRDQKYIYYQI